MRPASVVGLVLRVEGRLVFFFFQAEDGIRDLIVTGVQTCALPISSPMPPMAGSSWHWLHALLLNRGPSPVSGVNSVWNTPRPRSNTARCASVKPGRDRKSVV